MKLSIKTLNYTIISQKVFQEVITIRNNKFVNLEELQIVIGSTVMLDLYGCDTKLIKDEQYLEQVLEDSCNIFGMEITSHELHKVRKKHGVSITFIQELSHLSIHTWPEYGYVAINLFLCERNLDNTLIDSFFTECFRAKNKKIVSYDRKL